MTYGELKSTTSVFLLGDNPTLPKDATLLQAAVSAAYTFASTKCTALRLLTANKSNRIMRLGPGRNYIRMPELPVDDTDVLDIDPELGPAIARLLASYMARKTSDKDYHKVQALELMRDYEGKVEEFIEEMKNRGEYSEVGEEDNV